MKKETRGRKKGTYSQKGYAVMDRKNKIIMFTNSRPAIYMTKKNALYFLHEYDGEKLVKIKISIDE